MAQTPRRTPPKRVAKTERPGHDVVIAQQADKFPSVGMTLPSYQYDPRDKRTRSSSQTVVKRGRWQRFKQKITLKRSVIVMALLVLLIGGFVAGKFAWNAHKIFGGNIFGVFSSTKLKGEDSGRVNILLAGNSADDAGHSGGQLPTPLC